MKRRAFITLLGGAVTVCPITAWAQQGGMPLVGLLRSSSAAPLARIVEAFREGLSDAGFVEGQNVMVEQRWADNRLERLPELAADLLRRRVAVLVCNGPAVGIAKTATTTTPIVFVVGDDPVKKGLVASLNRPSGNLTGVTFFGGGRLAAKRLDLLRELFPQATLVALLLDPADTGIRVELSSIEAAARTLRLQMIVVNAESEPQLDRTFAQVVATGADAVLLGGGPLLFANRQRIVGLAARQALPMIYELRARVRRSWRSDQLFRELFRSLPASGPVRRPHSPWCQTC
jgi:putative tryptophan/tyrosine transport system substrate-binding protein